MLGQPVAALPDREALVQRGHSRLCVLARAKRTQIVGVVVEHTPAESKALSGLAALRARAQILAAPTPPPDTKPDTKPPEPATEAGKELTDGR